MAIKKGLSLKDRRSLSLRFAALVCDHWRRSAQSHQAKKPPAGYFLNNIFIRK